MSPGIRGGGLVSCPREYKDVPPGFKRDTATVSAELQLHRNGSDHGVMSVNW